MNKTKCKKLLSFALALVMLIILVPATSAEAAAKKPAISAKSMSIPVGKLSNKTEWFYHKNYTDAYHKGEKLTVKNKVKGAKYTFTSGNSKVAAIAKEGGYLTGVKPGSATITCTQTLKGKKTVVGKCKVTVVKSSVDRGCLPEEFMLGKGTYDPGYTGFLLRYRNPQAKYTFTADKKGLTVKERKYTQAQNQAFARKGEYDKIRPICGSYAYLQEVTATQPGTYTVTVNRIFRICKIKLFDLVATPFQVAAQLGIKISLGIRNHIASCRLQNIGNHNASGLACAGSPHHQHIVVQLRLMTVHTVIPVLSQNHLLFFHLVLLSLCSDP